jgi:hypothetical protein
MPFQYFTGSPVKFIPIDKSQKKQSTNPFAPNYIKPCKKDYYPPIFYIMRPIIIEKYNGKCFLCGEDGHDVHHIDYNKFNCEEWNLIYLCTYHHGLTNFNREYWQDFFRDKMGHEGDMIT